MFKILSLSIDHIKIQVNGIGMMNTRSWVFIKHLAIQLFAMIISVDVWKLRLQVDN